MRDYVNTRKPTQGAIWWRRHHQAVEFAFLILAVAIVGSVA